MVEGHTGRVLVDQLPAPTAFGVNVGPFWYYAGDASSAGARALVAALPVYHLLMPSPPEWLELAKAVFGARLEAAPRYSFSAVHLSSATLDRIVSGSPHRDQIVPLTAELAARLLDRPRSGFDITSFDAAADFLARGFGYVMVRGSKIPGVAYSSLACCRGIEVSIYVDESYRRLGIASALGALLALEALRRGLEPHWDAANPPSCRLAARLGYSLAGTYEAYCLLPDL